MNSLRLRITIYFIGLTLIVGLIFTIGMNNFIDGYYYGKKIESMNHVISDINKMYMVSKSEDEALMNIEYLGYQFEGKISIYDQSTQLVVYDSKRYQYTKGVIIEEITYKGNTAIVYETAYPVEGARWLIYIDQLDNDKLAMLQIPVVAIDEAIAIIQSFFNYLVLIGLFVAIILALFLANNISFPIKQLHKVANSIGNLKFDVEYIGSRKDEIGQLGHRLNQISHTLEKNICELTKELEKEKSIDRMRRRFVAQVSHELQTPISIISSYMEALCDGIVDDDEIASYYDVIEDESNKMSQIVKDLLQLSQLEADTIKFKMEAFLFKDYIVKIFERYKHIALRQNIEFTCSIDINPETYFYGDELRLEQGITNLLSNAFKHSDNYVYVDLTQFNDRIILSIENSGDTIDEVDINHIFESFYKGKTSHKKEGTGLGLSIASKIFAKHKIDYRVYNKKNAVIFELTMNQYLHD